MPWLVLVVLCYSTTEPFTAAKPSENVGLGLYVRGNNEWLARIPLLGANPISTRNAGPSQILTGNRIKTTWRDGVEFSKEEESRQTSVLFHEKIYSHYNFKQQLCTPHYLQ